MSIVDLSQVRWRKSSRSGSGTNDACVEVAFLPAEWHKSSRSGSGGNNDCVEVAFLPAEWYKSSRSGHGNNGNCVEVAWSGNAIGVRDSKNPAGPVLALPAPAWRSFLATLHHGSFDVR